MQTPADIDVTIERLELHEGDVVVMRFNYPLTPAIAHELTQKLYEALPKGVRCLVADPSIDISVYALKDPSQPAPFPEKEE